MQLFGIIITETDLPTPHLFYGFGEMALKAVFFYLCFVSAVRGGGGCTDNILIV